MTPRNEEKGRAYFLPVQSGAAAVLYEPIDKLGVALDRFLGLKADRLERACESSAFGERQQTRLWIQHRRVVAAHREFPQLCAGSFEELRAALPRDPELSGMVRKAQVMNDWATLLGDSLNRRLLSAYGEADYGEALISQPATARDLRAQRVVNIPGVPIPTLDAESQDYTELGRLSETVLSYGMVQRGVIVTISRRVLLNNDVDVVTRLMDNLGRATRRTLAREIWSLWASNATYGGDGVAWFDAAHSNLQTVAISEAEVIAAITKLLNQTEGGSGEKLGLPLRPGSVYLHVPSGLWGLAHKLNRTTLCALQLLRPHRRIHPRQSAADRRERLGRLPAVPRGGVGPRELPQRQASAGAVRRGRSADGTDVPR